jgi:hypothetical protein
MTPATTFFRHPIIRFSERITQAAALLALLTAVAALGFSGPLFAQDDVDLSDNETCLECHADTERSAPENSDRPRVHNDDGSLIQEDHDMWSCTDCHDYITEIPHPDEVLGSEVECTNCHDTTPEK